MDDRRTDGERVAEELRLRAGVAASLGSAFYEILLQRMADDAEAGGPTLAVLGPFLDRPFDDGITLRILGALHSLALDGSEPALAAHYPTAGGDGDAEAAFVAVREVLARPGPRFDEYVARSVQTNEVGRAAPLAGGIAVVAARTGLPIRLLEIGSSAGLNLRIDRFRFEAGVATWGDPASPVRFVDAWSPGVPPFGAARIVERAACDLDPIDATTDAGASLLLSYLWPGNAARFDLQRGAIEVARSHAHPVERADAVDWLAEQLAAPHPGVVTIVMHSIFQQYLGDRQADLDAVFAAAGARATAEAPVARVRLEPAPDHLDARLRITVWPDGAEEEWAAASFHHGPVHWYQEARPV